MNYAKVENNTITLCQLPQSFDLPDNEGTIIGFNNLPIEELNQYGFYPLIDITPDFDTRLSYRGEPIYSFDAENNRAIVEYAIIEYSLSELKKRAIQAVYAKCAAVLNQHSQGYSAVEIAQFPLLQSEILNYAQNDGIGIVGEYMQAVIDCGLHTAESLTAALMPKIMAQNEALKARAQAVIAIKAAISPADILPFL